MVRKEKFIQGEYYHIYSKVIFNIPEFSDSKNAYRLAQAFLLGNSTKSSQSFECLRNSLKGDRKASFEKALEISRSGEKIVDILCYSIMPDHYHLLIKELKDDGITNFIRKCNTSIAKYINIKNNRIGPLFESKFKAKHIDSNRYLLHLSVYINLNPLDFLIGKEWRLGKLKNWQRAKNLLINYPWSSARSFLKDNIKDQILSGTEIIFDQFNNRKDYEIFLQEWSFDNLGLNKVFD